MTDLPNRLLQRPAARTARVPEGGAAPAGGTGIDVLSDVFRCVRLTGSMLFLVEASAPWKSAAPAAHVFARLVLPAAQHLISYHVVTEGTCWGGIRGEDAQPMAAGDILVVPHGDPYFLANPASAVSAASDDEAVDFFRRMVAGELPQVVAEGGPGPKRTRFICGFLGCDARPFNPILAALPRVLHLRRTMQESEAMRHLAGCAVAELRAPQAGSREVLLRLSELMFMAAIRCHVEQLSAQVRAAPAMSTQVSAGWLAGLYEPLVGRALALLHAQPARAWSLEALAAETGSSRSVLAARFAHVVGHPPMRYLAAWRMQLATTLLAEPSAKVRTVAQAVGYDSEAAFSRAFTRVVGRNPVAWRSSGHRFERLAAFAPAEPAFQPPHARAP